MPPLLSPFDEMLGRMYAKDVSTNRLFVTGVLTTGIYCLPSCPARKPKPQNVVFFRTEDEAQEAGLRPCKRCRPDLFYAGEDPNRERWLAALSMLKRDPLAIPTVTSLADRLGVGLSKLNTLVRRYADTTPAELIHACRIDAAMRLLRSGAAGATEAAFAVGYESVSAFYERFKRTTGLTPGAYARNVVLETPTVAANPRERKARTPTHQPTLGATTSNISPSVTISDHSNAMARRG